MSCPTWLDISKRISLKASMLPTQVLASTSSSCRNGLGCDVQGVGGGGKTENWRNPTEQPRSSLACTGSGSSPLARCVCKTPRKKRKRNLSSCDAKFVCSSSCNTDPNVARAFWFRLIKELQFSIPPRNHGDLGARRSNITSNASTAARLEWVLPPDNSDIKVVQAAATSSSLAKGSRESSAFSLLAATSGLLVVSLIGVSPSRW
mmetsp:Transcript_82462/g.267119  ORF Transcript_82462/g.267119 Transcript_82462/m.267119 type:complete len:205 (-) Transcript_82462:265-879(-)